MLRFTSRIRRLIYIDVTKHRSEFESLGKEWSEKNVLFAVSYTVPV